jgi:heat shock protein HtpX
LPGRDLGLSVRMGIGLLLVATMYLVALVLALATLVVVLAERDWAALLGWFFLAGGLALAGVMHWLHGDDLVLRTARARHVERAQEPGLHRLVDRVAAAADQPPPRLALIRSWAPNALAAGMTPARATIAVTTELVRRLDERELEAVIAHELAHLANRDGIVMTIVSGPAMLGSAMWNSDDGRGKIAYLILYWPIHILGLMLMWTISRYREYVADRDAAAVTGAPEQLMSALQKIAGREPRGDLRGGAAVSALCIVPAQRKTRLDFLRRLEIFMDHPPLEKRIRKLGDLARDLGRAA